MKSKKLISLLCATAMTTSAFAGLVTTASAADTTLWSDDFNKQTEGLIVDGTYADAAEENTIVPGLTFVTTNRDKGDAGIYVDDAGNTVYTGSYYSVEGKSADDKYLHLSYPIFGDYLKQGRWGHVDFKETYTADATKDIVIDFDMKMTDGMIKGGTEDKPEYTNPILRIGTFDPANKASTAVAIDKAAASIGDDWVDARVIITNSGAKVYIDGTEVTSAANAAVKSAAQIGLYFKDDASLSNMTPPLDAKGDWLKADAPTKSPAVDVDNFVIYSADAGTATATSATPAISSQTPGGSAKPIPTPYVISAAPELAAPAAADGDSLEVYNFDDEDIANWYIQNDAQTITDVDGMTINIGGRNGGESSTFAEIAKNETGKVLRLQAGAFSHAGRAPLAKMNTSMADALAAGKTIAMSFDVMLSAPKGMETGAVPRLYFVKNDTKAGDSGDGAYNKVAAVLTTDIDEEIRRSDENSDIISTYVTADEWHYVTLVVSPKEGGGAEHRLFVDGEQTVDCDLVGTGTTAEAMEDLPLLTPESKAAKVNGSDVAPDYSLAVIDNMMIYYGEPSEPKRMVAAPGTAPVVTKNPATPVPKHTATIDYADNKATITTTETEAFDGVLIVAKYKADGTLDAIAKVENVTGISAAAAKEVEVGALANGDKIMLWNNLNDMVPYAVKTVTGSLTTPAPGHTPKPVETPEATPETTPETTPGTTPATTPATTPETTPATTPAPKYAVTVATATNGTVAVKNGTTTLDATALAAVEEGTELTVVGTPAEGYLVKSIEVAPTTQGSTTTVTVTDGKFTMPAEAVTVTVTFEAEPVVPYAAGTVTFDEDDAATLFKDYSRVTSTVATATVTGNTTKVNSLVSSGQSGAGYEKYSEAFKAKGDAVEVSFDVTKLNANSFLSVRTTKGGTSNRNNDATGRIFTVGREGSTDTKLKIWGSGDVVALENTDAVANWYHIEAVVNNTAKTTSIKVYNYKANNNYANETPIYQNAALGFRDNTADGVVGMDYHGALSGASAEVDNVRFYDETYVDPISVTATDATVDKAQAVKDDVITITPTVAAGKKLTAVKVNGTAITADGDGAYKYKVTGTEDAIAVTAELARADATAIEISGAANVAIADGTSTYTAAVKAGETTVDGTVTWSVAAKEGAAALDAGTTISDAGVLTIANTQAATTAVITATTKKDVANSEDTAVVTATKEVVLTAEAVYNVTKGAETNGTFTVSAATATAADTITVVPTPASGYAIGEVSYTVGETKTVVNPAGNAYTFTGLSGDAVVNVTFTAIEYNVTNGYTAENGNSIAITVGENAVTKATIGQDVVITPTIAQGYKLSALTYTAEGGEAVNILANKTFKMPANDVTINATFETFDGVYYSQDFSAADLDAATVLGVSALRSGARAAVGSIADGAYKWTIASDNKRSKAYTSMETPIDFSGDANIAFDLTLNPVGSASKPTVAELTLGNSDHNALFAIRVDSENLAGGFSVYAGGKVNNSVGQNSEAGDIGTSKNNWGSNEYVWNISNAEGPAMTVLKKSDESVLPYVKARAYKVALSITGNDMTVTVTDSTDATATATATLDVTGLKRDIKHFVAFLDQGSSSGSGSYMSIDNISVKAPWSTVE